MSAPLPTRAGGAAVELEPPPDLVRLAGAARDAGHEVMLFERSAPGAVSVVGIGRRYELVSVPGGVALEDAGGRRLDHESGPRLQAAGRLWRRLVARVGDRRGSPSGPVALGGFAFDLDREPGEPWLGFPALLLRVPALTVSLVGRRAFAAGDLALLHQPATATADGAVRLAIEPSPAEAEWKELVARASRRLRRGAARKVVLAREVVVHADRPILAGAVARRLQLAYPTCYRYLITGGDGSALVGASPELLVRRSGPAVTCQPMAGSVGRGGDEAADAALAGRLRASAKDAAEHRLTVAHVAAALGGLGGRVSAASPEVLPLPNIQHLATTVEATFDPPGPDLLQVAAALHPTPAVGGAPSEAARPLIRELEGMERGWYAGAVGWIDARGDGELAVAIRCGLLWEDGARLYAGAGIMPGSDPESELEETRMKLQALLGALAPAPHPLPDGPRP
ncbi:MAG TPA: isochorismate synthase [Candidatus Dormibacteraeota bacterium]|nr:isochorismate synthase [Candidatus Dormibacteraeota bacterium]